MKYLLFSVLAVGMIGLPIVAAQSAEQSHSAIQAERKAAQAERMASRIEKQEAAQEKRKVALGKAIARFCKNEGADLTPRVCLIQPFEMVDIGDLTRE
jgi:Tfp pilus assembly protein PilV